MFQTNQGPSFPAHQFLFSGTSAPDIKSYSGGYYEWFAAQNPKLSNGNSTPLTGCAFAPAGTVVYELDPTLGDPPAPGYTPEPIYPGDTAGYPCYTHPTMASLLDSNGKTWKYYTDSPNDEDTPAGASIWTAPNAIVGICNPVVNGQCTGADWANVIIPGDPNYGGYATPILWDLGDNNQSHCGLPAVSWVVPDGDWSDHAGTLLADGGPSFVAAIVNGVGGKNNDGTSFATQCNYWDNTVVLITWDDWGGFYDDVDPLPTGQIGYGNGTGQQYVYGFRVPLLVVSKYAKPGYISGPKDNATCVNTTYCHDFGSLLNFIEHIFNLGTQGINDSVYPYADSLAMDANCSTCTYSLADFFGSQTTSFVLIQGWKYPTTCFINPHGTGCFPNYPMDPDNDVIDAIQ